MVFLACDNTHKKQWMMMDNSYFLLLLQIIKKYKHFISNTELCPCLPVCVGRKQNILTYRFFFFFSPSHRQNGSDRRVLLPGRASLNYNKESRAWPGVGNRQLTQWRQGEAICNSHRESFSKSTRQFFSKARSPP